MTYCPPCILMVMLTKQKDPLVTQEYQDSTSSSPLARKLHTHQAFVVLMAQRLYYAGHFEWFSTPRGGQWGLQDYRLELLFSISTNYQLSVHSPKFTNKKFFNRMLSNRKLTNKEVEQQEVEQQGSWPTRKFTNKKFTNKKFTNKEVEQQGSCATRSWATRSSPTI